MMHALRYFALAIGVFAFLAKAYDMSNYFLIVSGLIHLEVISERMERTK